MAAFSQFVLPQEQGRFGRRSRLIVRCLQSLQAKKRFTALIVFVACPCLRQISDADNAV